MDPVYPLGYPKRVTLDLTVDDHHALLGARLRRGQSVSTKSNIWVAGSVDGGSACRVCATAGGCPGGFHVGV